MFVSSFQLAGRPGHVPARQHVEVQVEHALPRLLSTVGDHPELGNAQVLGDLGNHLKAVGHHGGIFRRNLPAGCNVGLGNHQEMGGCLGINVIKGIDQFVLIDLLGGNFSPGDLQNKQSLMVSRSFL